MPSIASWQEVIPRALPVGSMRRVLEGQWEGTVVGLHEDGSQFTLWVVMTPRRSNDGMPIGFLAMWSDIAGGVRLTVELERTSAHTHSRPEFVPDALVTVNTSDKTQLANAEAAILHGDRQKGSGRPAVEMLIADRYLDRHPGLRIAFFPESRPHPSGTGPQRSVQHQNRGANCYVHKQIDLRRCCDVVRAMRVLWLRTDPSPRSHL
jgi:hypothetical protein